MELEGLSDAASPGMSLVSLLGLQDVRLDVEVTSNRPDMLSHRGVAREVAPRGDASLAEPPIPGEEPAAAASFEGIPSVEGEAEASGGGLTIRIEAPELCPRYLGLVVRGVRVGPSPVWLQTRLRAAGARPINNVVDATNYVLLELGQPLHAFDLARVGGDAVVVRRAREGERIRTLDGTLRNLTPEMLAICDAERPIAIAGVMGGEDSEVTAETTDILLECALFAPGPTRATRKALGLSTDASYRFERGVDPDGLRDALVRCARLVVAVAGGRSEGPIVDVSPERPVRARVELRPERVSHLLGIPFDPGTVRELLVPLGFRIDGSGDTAAGNGNALAVGVPGWRSWDVTREVDLIEEVARTYGYDRFPDALGAFRPSSVPDDPLFALEDGLRDELSAWGLLEGQSPAFAPEGEGEVEIINPISMEERWLRSSLLPAMFRKVAYNLSRGTRDVRLFELGTVFAPGEPGEAPHEATHLAAVLHGRRVPEHWSGEDEPVDIWDLKGLLQAVAERVAPGDWEVAPAEAGTHPRFEPGGALVVREAGGGVVGMGGRAVTGALDLPRWAGDVWALEVSLPRGVRPPEGIRVRPVPAHPGVERDLALLVSDERPAASVVEVVRRAAGGLLAEVAIFDVYRGRGVPAGNRSLAVRLRFRAEDRTLTDDEVDAAVAAAAQALEEELGVRIRGG